MTYHTLLSTTRRTLILIVRYIAVIPTLQDASGPTTGWYASLGGTGGSAAGLGCRLSPKDSCCSSSHPGVSTSRTCAQCSRSGRTYPSPGRCWNSSAQVGDCGPGYRDPCTSGSDGGCDASRVYKGLNLRNGFRSRRLLGGDPEVSSRGRLDHEGRLIVIVSQRGGVLLLPRVNLVAVSGDDALPHAIHGHQQSQRHIRR